METKVLKKLAIAALVMSAQVPVVGMASDATAQVTLLAQGCGGGGSSEGPQYIQSTYGDMGETDSMKEDRRNRAYNRMTQESYSSSNRSANNADNNYYNNPNYGYEVGKSNATTYRSATGYDASDYGSNRVQQGRYVRGEERVYEKREGMMDGNTYQESPSQTSSRRYQGSSYNRGSSYYQTPQDQSTYQGGYSSYQGTSTGPGVNDGYPATPRGSYSTRTYEDSSTNNYNNNRR